MRCAAAAMLNMHYLILKLCLSCFYHCMFACTATCFVCTLQEAAILGALCFVMALVVLLFFSSVLLNIVDAVFMCYALDLDTQSVTKAEVHEVFSQVCHAPPPDCYAQELTALHATNCMMLLGSSWERTPHLCSDLRIFIL